MTFLRPALCGFGLLVFPWGLVALDTTIKGEKMEVLEKGERIHFSGGVKLIRGSDVLTASDMETTKRRDKATAHGNVKFTRIVSEMEKWDGSSQRGFYDTQTGEGYLEGDSGARAHLIQTKILSSTSTQKIDVLAHRFDFSKDKDKAVGTGEVYGKTVDPRTEELYEFWSERADYDGVEKKITLTAVKKKKPVALQTKGNSQKRITGNLVIYYIESQRFTSEGEAEAVFSDAPAGPVSKGPAPASVQKSKQSRGKGK